MPITEHVNAAAPPRARWVVQRRFRGISVHHRGYESPLLRSVLDNPDAYLADGRYETLYKDDGTTTVATVHGGDQRFVVKRYNTKNPWHAVRRAVRTTRARNCWRFAHRALDSGLLTPTPVAMVEERIGPLRQRSYYITEYVHGVPIRDYLAEASDHDDIVEALSALFSGMLGSGLSHGDMKATNLLVVEGQIFLLDLDAASIHRTALGAQRAYRRDRARFLRNWASPSALRQRLEEALPTI